jgi:hypothetical protein
MKFDALGTALIVNYEDQLPTPGHLGWRLNELADTGKK